MASAYRVQIVHNATEKIAAWAPGLEREHDLIDDLIARVQAKGVGFFRTEAHVLTDVRAAFDDLLYTVKSQVPPIL